MLVIASLAVLIVGYLIGCILGSNIIYILTGVNLKETGSKNAGATNAVITLGWMFGIFVALIDICKAIFALLFVQISLSLYPFSAEEIVVLLYVTGAAVIIGHNFPIHMKFNGGKGTASLIGVLLSLNWKVGLFAIFSFFIISFISNYLIVGVINLYVVLGMLAAMENTIIPLIISIILLCIAIVLHMENFKRIRYGLEPQMSLLYEKRKA